MLHLPSSLPVQKMISNTLNILIPVKRPINPPKNIYNDDEQIGGRSLSPTEVGECASEGHPLVLVDGADVGRGLLDLDVG